MSEKQKKIMETLDKVLPKMSREDQSYLLGYGEGVAAAMRVDKSEEAGERPASE